MRGKPCLLFSIQYFPIIFYLFLYVNSIARRRIYEAHVTLSFFQLISNPVVFYTFPGQVQKIKTKHKVCFIKNWKPITTILERLYPPSQFLAKQATSVKIASLYSKEETLPTLLIRVKDIFGVYLILMFDIWNLIWKLLLCWQDQISHDKWQNTVSI